MAIPKFTKDVEVIQKLSDLPNTTDGLTAEQLKAKFDEAALLVKTFLNSELIPAIQAKNIPFDKTGEIDAADIQNAIVEVQKQVRDAASGTIVNGSVTKEKLSAELLARVYGGRPWVSMKTPDSGDNVASDFPIGQVWLRPAFDVVNARTTNWTGNGCTVAAEAQKVTLTGNKTVTATKMTQSLTGIGQAGDIVHILFDVTERDSEITNVTMAVNGGEAETINGSVEVEAELMVNGSLMLEIGAVWPSTSLAGGNLVIENLAIVNVSQLHRQLTEGQAIPDWAAYLRNLLPLESYHSPAEVYMQVTDGNWWPMGFEVLPVSRGGTGYSSLQPGQMLYAGNDGSFEILSAPSNEDAVISFQNGKPEWIDATELAARTGFLRIKQGSYVGNGETRNIDLGVTPKMFWFVEALTLGIAWLDGYSAKQWLRVLNTSTNRELVYNAYIKLSGDKLELWHDGDAEAIRFGANALYFNEIGQTYNWVALY